MRISILKLFSLFAICVAVAACGDKNRNVQDDLKKAEKGDVYYGGTFNFNEVENFRSLHPLNITEVVGHRIANQIYEGLVRFSQRDLSIQPAIAESWEIDSAGTLYTFKIRKGVKFHEGTVFAEGKGREVTAHDVKYCFDRLSEPSTSNQGFWIIKNRIKGATEYYKSAGKGSAPEGGVPGVRVIDDYTVEIELEESFSGFLQILSTAFAYIYPKEANEKFGDEMRVKAVGTGPFKLKDVREDAAVILMRNDNYWGKDDYGNQLPYLDALKFSFIKEKKSELLEFKKGNLDLVYRLPLEMVTEVLTKDEDLKKEYENFVLQKTPSLSVQYYGFLHQSDVFDDKRVRQAFNYAIDRKQIVDYTLKGTAIAGKYGIVPPALVGYDAKSVEGYSFDPDKAKQLLSEAGYPNGEGFPELTLQTNSGGGKNVQVAEAIENMLEENLGISINISILPFAQHLENLETGKALFWRSGWIADYPSPENFLNLLYGEHVPEETTEKAYLNPVRYKSARFDTLFKQALRTLDEDERFNLYLQADQQAIEDAAIIPIFYEKDYRLLQPYVKNFHQNAMEYRLLRDVYFVPNQQAQ